MCMCQRYWSAGYVSALQPDHLGLNSRHVAHALPHQNFHVLYDYLNLTVM